LSDKNRKRLMMIPARGGSKRIEGKNIRKFCGKPLIAYSLEVAKESKLFDVIHVSTEDREIRRIVEQSGFLVDFLRDAALADDKTGLMPVLQWVMKRYASEGQIFDDVCMLSATAPLIEVSDLEVGWETYANSGFRRPVLAVSEFSVPVEWAMRMDSSGGLSPVQPESLQIRSQDLTKKYFDAGSFVFYNAWHLLNETPPRSEDYLGCLLPKHKVVDIDEEEDLAFARMIYLGRAAIDGE
jgi:pseudaminic acid cytidylyltransferase